MPPFVYQYLYLALFAYIAFEGFYEWSFYFFRKHIVGKEKYRELKETNYFLYQFKILSPMFTALAKPRVLVAIVMYLVHHAFIERLVIESHDPLINLQLINTGVNWGVWIAGAAAVITALIAKETREEIALIRNKPVTVVDILEKQ